MNQTSLLKLKECLELAKEFVRNENFYTTGGIVSQTCYIDIGHKVKRKSDDIRREAEEKASKLERQEKCANLIKECLEYINTVDKFENQ